MPNDIDRRDAADKVGVASPATDSETDRLPLAARVLMRRFGLLPGLASAVAAAAGFNLEVR